MIQKTSLNKIVVIGQGYVGLPLAVAAAEAGWRVVGIDKSSQLVERLNQGSSHIEDVSGQRLRKLIDSHSYHSTTSFSEVIGAKICVICVPTPLKEGGLPDLTHLESAIEELAPFLDDDTLVINESTSFPGTLRDIIKGIIDKKRPKGSNEIHLASAPERIDPKNLHWNLFTTPRLVSGIDKESTELAVNFYSTICSAVTVVSSPEVAEMAKLLENTFRQVNIALVNSLVPFCNTLGIDLREVVKAAGTKPYGFMEFHHGAGVGGHCIPIDPVYLLWKSRQVGVDLPLVATADKTNSEMPNYVVERLIELIIDSEAQNILICGVSYKSGVADIRESPAQKIADLLIAKGFKVFWADSLAKKFYDYEEYDNQELAGAIIVSAQEGLTSKFISNLGVPVLDCTGAFKGIVNVFQL